MKYLLLVHQGEEAFGKISETQRKEMLAESLHLTHQLHANEQYVHASPLHPAATGVIVRVREGKQVVTDGPDCRLLPHQCQGSQRSDQHRHTGARCTHWNRRG